jgi:DNA-binding response OmpR family regulator
MGKILIVDDDKLIVSALSIRLKAEGHEIEAAYDGPSAVQIAKTHAPSLIIMDINLPFSSGLRAVKQIREATGSAKTPVIFLTASKVPALREQAIALGAAGFLEKPYDANELVALVRQTLVAPISPSLSKTDTIPALEKTGARLAPRTILVVDGDKKIVETIAIRLRTEGHKVIVASDAESALELAQSERPALVVLDVAPPVAKAFQDARSIVDATDSSETPVIFISASRLPEIRDRTIEFGAAGFLEKPYDAKELLSLIRKALARPVRA